MRHHVPGIDSLSPEREVQLVEGADRLAQDPSFQANRIKILRDLFAEIRRLRAQNKVLSQRVDVLRSALIQADQDFSTQSLLAQPNILKALELDAELENE